MSTSSNRQALGANDLCRGRVLGDFRGERAYAASAVQDLAPPHHVLALCETDADRLRAILPARLKCIENGAFNIGPKAFRTRTYGHGNDQRRVVAERRQHRLEIVARRQRVGIGQHDVAMLGRVPAFDTIIELGIGADVIITGQQSSMNAGIFGDEAFHQRDDRIMRRLHAEQQFVIRIIQFERGAQRLLTERFQPAQRTHQRHRRRFRGRPQFSWPRPAFPGRHIYRGKIQCQKRGAPSGANIGDNGHIDLS